MRYRTAAALAQSVQREHRMAFHRKTCAAVTCKEEVRPGRVFCPNHWFFLPEWLRRSIINTFRDAEWPQHQDAIRQGADYIDAANIEARESGFAHVVSARDHEDKVIRYAGRRIA